MTEKEELYNLLKIEEKKAKISKIQSQMNSADFWKDSQKASKLTSEMSAMQKIVDQWEKAESEKDFEELKIKAVLSGQYDFNNAYLSIHAGAGGTEAQDWAQMLLSMFEKYAQKKDFNSEVLEKSSGEEAGIKSTTLKISGPYAFGLLKSEAGVHRLVRISPFDADKARHTSFALVEVIPELKDDEEIKIDEKDLRVDVYHSSGHGGQSVNTTDSAVRITHLPTGIVVSCQNERSQLQNKETAMKVLQAKLIALKLKKQKEDLDKIRGEHVSMGWGNQIRSYVLQPYQQVKDHRTDVISSEPGKVLEGNLDDFINAYLKSNINL